MERSVQGVFPSPGGSGEESGLGWRRWRLSLVPRVSLISVQKTLRQVQGERKGKAFGMGQDVESSGHRGEEMASFACAAGLSSVLETLRQAQGERKRGAFGMGQGVESPDFSGACLSGAGLVPLGFRFLLKVDVGSRLRTNIVLKRLRVKRKRHIFVGRETDCENWALEATYIQACRV